MYNLKTKARIHTCIRAHNFACWSPNGCALFIYFIIQMHNLIELCMLLIN